MEKTNQLLELLSLKEIREALAAGRLDSQLRIYDEREGGWIKMSRHPALAMALAVPQQPADKSREWYYLQGQTPIGAFTYLEMIRLIQAKKIQSSAIVWRPGIPQWVPASLLLEFQPTTIQQVHHSGVPGIKNYFLQRRFFRFSYAAKFVLHNEEKLWKGVSYELAPGGIGMLLNSADLNIGQEVFVHKTSRGGGVAINAVAVVRSQSTHGMKVGQAKVGLEFVDVSKETQNEIAALGLFQPLGLIQSKISR